ncbi:MAG: T9SS type A sorting domain-containing protein [Bacteroidia bacterium]
MKKQILLIIFISISIIGFSQPVKFKRSFAGKFLKANAVDSFHNSFAGGLNTPQFSEIDLNGDGQKDLYVFDRSANKSITFIRTAGNQFKYEPFYANMFPALNNWVLLRDYDGDGKEDIFSEVDYNTVPEPDKFIWSHGIRFLRNTSKSGSNKLEFFQWRNQIFDTGTSSLPPSNIGIQNLDIPSIEDMDNDGDLDLLYFGYGKNTFSYTQNVSVERGFKRDSILFVFRDDCWGNTYYKVNTHGFVLHDKSPCYRNYKTKMHNGSTVSTFDMDGDGDKDVLYGDVGFNSLLLLKNGKTINSLGRDSIIDEDSIYPNASAPASIEIFPATYFIDVDADGKKDMLVAPNADVAAKNNQMVLYYKNTGSSTVPNFTYQNNQFLVGEMMDLGGGAKPVLVDIDADNDLDLVVATQGEFTQTQNSIDRLVLFKNEIKANGQANFILADTNFLMINSGSGNKIFQMHPSFGDLNGDNKPDLIIGDMNGKIHYYENTSASSNTISFEKKSSNFFEMYAGTFITPQLIDLNKDNKLDIVAGRKNGSVVYFENKGSISAPQFNSSPDIDSIGKISSAEATVSGGQVYYFDGYSNPYVCDLDKDGKFEILLGGNDGKVQLFSNFDLSPNRVCQSIDSVFIEKENDTAKPGNFGKKASVSVGDINKDGSLDLIIGNIRGGLDLLEVQAKGIISGLSSVKKESFNCLIYPNPAQETIIIKNDQQFKSGTIEIFDINGSLQQIEKLNRYENQINISQLKPGFYIVKIENDKGEVLFKKIIKE